MFNGLRPTRCQLLTQTLQHLCHAKTFQTSSINEVRQSRLPSELTRRRRASAASLPEKQEQKEVGTPIHRQIIPSKYKPKINPADTSVILFPGQGSQFSGMGEELLETPLAMELFNKAKSILGFDLLETCLHGSDEELSRTEICQPAIFVSSLGAVEKLRIQLPGMVESAVATAGFSVGEFAALVFCGSLSFEDGLRLVKIRGEAMAKASEMVPSGMMTVTYGPGSRLNFAMKAAGEWCVRRGIDREIAVCKIANYLFPHCKVIAGHDEALNFISNNAKEFGLGLCKRLPVSGAFHTPLMEPAERVFQEALKKIVFNKPLICCHSNVKSTPYGGHKTIMRGLKNQMTKPVLWEQILQEIFSRRQGEEFPNTWLCGPGGREQLTILGRVNKKAREKARFVNV